MNKNEIIIAISCLVILGIILTWAFNNATNFYNAKLEAQETKNFALVVEKNLYESQLEHCLAYGKFREAVCKIGSVKWAENYDCYEHSQDMVKALEERGIKASVGVVKDRSHAFVLVWVESIGGEFIKPDYKAKLLEIRNVNKEVVCSCK